MDCDVLIIGTGQAGVPLAEKLAREGRRVVVAERARLGGTCVNYGCTPTKAVIASARAAHVARTAAGLGVSAGPVAVDMDAVVDRKEAMVVEWREGVARRLEEAGDALTLVRGHARFTAPRTVRVGEDTWTAGTVVVNTGARPVRPSIPGLDQVDGLDNAGLLSLRSLPERLVVLGGGYIGCELGQAWRRFGAEVTVVDHNPRLLAREDAAVSEAVADVFRAEGIELRLGGEVAGVARGPDGGVVVRLEDGGEVSGSHLLVATGRRPNTDDLGVEAAGLALDGRGALVVDDRYRTSVEGVYAVGDVAGGPQFTHAAWDDHRILHALLGGDDRRTRADRLIPSAIFTDPQVGRVGLSERQARDRGVEHTVVRIPFRHIARARETGREAGLVQVVVGPDGAVLGASIVGAEAAELIHVFVALMAAGAPVSTLVDAEMVHPTYAEGLQSVLFQLDAHAG